MDKGVDSFTEGDTDNEGDTDTQYAFLLSAIEKGDLNDVVFHSIAFIGIAAKENEYGRQQGIRVPHSRYSVAPIRIPFSAPVNP